MGTRSNIGVEYPGGLIEFVYCHWDGYLSNNGEILFRSYTTSEDVIELVQLGSISSLGDSIENTKDYHRWRGEDIDIQTTNDRNESYQQEYAYIFSIEEGQWYCQGHHTDEWMLLEDALNESEEH